MFDVDSAFHSERQTDGRDGRTDTNESGLGWLESKHIMTDRGR